MTTRSQPRGSLSDIFAECKQRCDAYKVPCDDADKMSRQTLERKCREDLDLHRKVADCANGRYYCSVWKRNGHSTCAEILERQHETREGGHLEAYRRSQKKVSIVWKRLPRNCSRKGAVVLKKDHGHRRHLSLCPPEGNPHPLP